MKYDIEIKVVQYDTNSTVGQTGTEVRTCDLDDKEVLAVLGRIRKFLDGLPESCVDPRTCPA
jgi:hypothetical protein